MGRRQTISPAMRAEVIRTYGNDCWLGLPGCIGLGEEDDHIRPHHLGGRDTVANIRRACKHCNASRQDRILSGYGAWSWATKSRQKHLRCRTNFEWCFGVGLR